MNINLAFLTHINKIYSKLCGITWKNIRLLQLITTVNQFLTNCFSLRGLWWRLFFFLFLVPLCHVPWIYLTLQPLQEAQETYASFSLTVFNSWLGNVTHSSWNHLNADKSTAITKWVIYTSLLDISDFVKSPEVANARRKQLISYHSMHMAVYSPVLDAYCSSVHLR